MEIHQLSHGNGSPYGNQAFSQVSTIGLVHEYFWVVDVAKDRDRKVDGVEQRGHGVFLILETVIVVIDNVPQVDVKYVFCHRIHIHGKDSSLELVHLPICQYQRRTVARRPKAIEKV